MLLVSFGLFLSRLRNEFLCVPAVFISQVPVARCSESLHAAHALSLWIVLTVCSCCAMVLVTSVLEASLLIVCCTPWVARCGFRRMSPCCSDVARPRIFRPLIVFVNHPAGGLGLDIGLASVSVHCFSRDCMKRNSFVPSVRSFGVRHVGLLTCGVDSNVVDIVSSLAVLRLAVRRLLVVFQARYLLRSVAQIRFFEVWE